MEKLTIDGITINAKHYLQFPEKEAIKKIVEDGNSIPGDKKEKEEWAKNAYKLMKGNAE